MIIQNIFQPLFKADDVSASNPEAWLIDAFVGPQTLSGTKVNTRTVLTLPAYYGAIKVIAEDIGKLPLNIFRSVNEMERELASDHRVHFLMHDQPNPDMSSMDFKQTLQFHALGAGNGYAEIVKNRRGEIGSLSPIHPSRVMPERNARGQLVYDVRVEDLDGFVTGEVIRFPQDKIFHLRGLSTDGIVGFSVIQMLRESLGLGIASQEYSAASFGEIPIVFHSIPSSSIATL